MALNKVTEKKNIELLLQFVRYMEPYLISPDSLGKVHHVFFFFFFIYFFSNFCYLSFQPSYLNFQSRVGWLFCKFFIHIRMLMCWKNGNYCAESKSRSNWTKYKKKLTVSAQGQSHTSFTTSQLTWWRKRR